MALTTYAKEQDEVERAKRQAANNDCGLLKLPAELRNQIYYNVLEFDAGSTNDIVINECRSSYLQDLDGWALLQTCRALREELTPVIFGTHNFTISIVCREQYVAAREWVISLSEHAMASLRYVEVPIEIADWFITSEDEPAIIVTHFWLREDEFDYEEPFYVTPFADNLNSLEVKEAERQVTDYLNTLGLRGKEGRLTKEGLLGLFEKCLEIGNHGQGPRFGPPDRCEGVEVDMR